MIASTVSVLFPVALDRSFTYAVPPESELAPGDVVSAPFGGRDAIGVVWDDAPEIVPSGKLRPIRTRLEGLPLPAQLRAFIDWVGNYTLSPRGLLLRIAISGRGDGGGEMRVVCRATGRLPLRRTAARSRVLTIAGDGALRSRAELALAAGVSRGVVDGLVAEGCLETLEIKPEGWPRPDPDHNRPALSPEQQAAADALCAMVHAHAFQAVLLEGVTGSGKTEVYLEALATTLQAGGQALVLLPEIALTSAVTARFAARFGAEPAVWHSTLTPRQRARVWDAVASGDARVVIGARSALFLPFANLGLIVVDEEHDAAYKQEDAPIYHARDMAVVRGTLAACPVVLASATPSLETRANAARGRYARLELPDRFGGRTLPSLMVADLTRHPPPPGRFIGPQLETAVRETLDAGHQALLFLNRRGYAPLTLCRACGHRLQCPNCSTWLVQHRHRPRLVCHHCGHDEAVPRACPSCGTEGKLAPVGPGVERICEEAASLFPAARISVLSSDLTGIARLQEELQSIERGEVDLIIGTQLVTKGHNFPGLALVGVVDADLGLGTADPRAAERTFQALDQVTGRAGRGATAGRAVLQTHDPAHPVITALARGERAAFYDAETETRERAGLPPFGRMASLIISAPDKVAAERHARALLRAAPPSGRVRLLGPAEAPIALLRGRHRYRITVKTPREFDLSAYLRAWRGAMPKAPGAVAVSVDIDPVSFV